MKILIADDEELVRAGLKDTLLTIKPAADVFEAVNGRDLIKKVKSFFPEICFVDIRMPGISGLEAIEQLTGEFPDIIWIILSGYSDFDYARKALNLGAIDYLLKPASENEVAAALEKAIERRVDSQMLKREKFEYHVSGILNNSSSAEFDDYLIEIERYAAMIFVSGKKDVAESLTMQSKLFTHLRRIIDVDSFAGNSGLFNILDGLPAVIAGGDNPEDMIKKLYNSIPEYYSQYSIIFSPVKESLPELLNYFEAASELKIESISINVDENSDRSSRIVSQAEKLIIKQYNEPIGVAQIAEQLNVTPNYLSSLFKKYKNVSFTKFITDIRLNEAPKLLEVPGMTVKDAASKLGYMSSRHFARLFRERYGMPPSDYRK